MSKNNLNGLYAITDPALMGSNLLAMAEKAVLGGIHLLQYRNKMATHKQQEIEARALAKLCKKHNVIFIINDDVELALNVNADGVHLGQKDTHISEARDKLGKNKIIGISCNNQLELAKRAQQQGADYIAFGRFFNSLTKPSAPKAELSLLSEAKKIIQIPIVAIGGITHKSAPDLINEGADMLAVIQGIFGEQDILNATRQFVELFTHSDTPQASL